MITEHSSRSISIDGLIVPAWNIQVDGFPRLVEDTWYGIYFELPFEHMRHLSCVRGNKALPDGFATITETDWGFPSEDGVVWCGDFYLVTEANKKRNMARHEHVDYNDTDTYAVHMNEMRRLYELYRSGEYDLSMCSIILQTTG